MRLNNHFASVIYKLALLAAVSYGIFLSIFRPLDYGLHPLYFFTTQSNLLVSLTLIYFLFFPHPSRIRVIVRGSVMLCIAITGLVFHFLLVSHYPEYFSSGVDFRGHLTHTIAPIGYILDWLLFDHKKLMHFSHIRYWVIYPLLYWLVTVFRGTFSGVYPYFFMDIDKIGLGSALLWLLMLFAIFVLLGLIIISADNLNLPGSKMKDHILMLHYIFKKRR